ncbi:helix-turn-helix transcriptional regulator [Domibacillus aminovorans]|uniref:helix-turn-helix transcriptional regulator n=1 Tax=Domibacillus aminovorans TaxID=29332 RepID=UPI003D200E5A
MKVYVLAKDALEAQGIEWMIKSHIQDIELVLINSPAHLTVRLESERPLIAVLDMDQWEQEALGELMKKHNVRWLGLSSERIFQTAYRALRFRAEDVLFRPFSPMELIRHIQQARFQLRNEKQLEKNKTTEEPMISYPDLFFTGRKLSQKPYRMAAILTPDSETLPIIYTELLTYPFTKKTHIFALTDFILVVQEDAVEMDTEEYQAFLISLKERVEQQLAIVIQQANPEDPFKNIYQKLRKQTERIFFEGYDIILQGSKMTEVKDMDPFLSPLEQREWIEMLEMRNMKEVQNWLEQHYLTMEPPYPDPEIVRISLTSVLAQVRRYMKSHDIRETDLEQEYHFVFHEIIRQPVMYRIIQLFQVFIHKLFSSRNRLTSCETRQSLVEKTRGLIELNYWNSQWNLADCADTLRMNKSTLSRRFSAESGRTFLDTLHGIRLEEAKRLLKESDLPFYEIARLTGYSHQTQFNAKFKKYEHRTPSEFRSGL